MANMQYFSPILGYLWRCRLTWKPTPDTLFCREKHCSSKSSMYNRLNFENAAHL